MEYALRVSDLTKKYRDFSLQIQSMDIPQGTVVGLIGENGAGKTTLLELIAGIRRPSSGKVEISGHDTAVCVREARQDLAYLPEDSCWNRDYTPVHVGRILDDVYPRWNRQKFEEYLQRFGVNRNGKLKEMSRGMRIRMELAAAFSRDAKLIMTDETTAGLDPVAREEVMELLGDYAKEETHTVLLSSHITEDLDRICDYFAFLHRGRLRLFLSADEIHEEYGVLEADERMLEALAGEDVVAAERGTYSCRVLVRSRQALQKVFPDAHIRRAGAKDLLRAMILMEKKEEKS